MSKQKGYRIPESQKSCKYGNHWDEDVAGDGGSRMQMFECTYDGDEETIEICDETNTCPCYEPCETIICPKHDIEFYDGDYCDLCHPELENY